MKKNKSTFVKLLKRIKKHSFFIILSLIMAAVTVATTLYVPILVGRGIDCIIGVNNVDDRIKMIYGMDYGINIVSKEESGTTVTIKIPIRK